jgi:hypothetical protein
LLEEYERTRQDEIVLKLASFPKSSIEETLLSRRLDPNSIGDAKAILALVGAPFTPEEAVAYSFTRHGSPPTFGRGRFGDGSHPVYYSALETETCEEEVRRRLRDAKAVVPFDRYFQFIACDFSGTILNLRGSEAAHPELVSHTEDGYPFCQALAQVARNSAIEAFHTPSARKAGGICTPVFSPRALANARFVGATRVTI